MAIYSLIYWDREKLRNLTKLEEPAKRFYKHQSNLKGEPSNSRVNVCPK